MSAPVASTTCQRLTVAKLLPLFCKEQKIKIMGLKKGMTNNLAGRTPGALNKIGKDLRMNISDFLNDNFDDFVKAYNKLEGKDKVSAYIDLIPFVVARMQASSVTIDIEAQKKTVHDLFPDELTLDLSNVNN